MAVLFNFLLSGIRKFFALSIGVPIVIIGLILIPVPFPVPGLLIVVFGLFVLSLEFEWAKKLLKKARELFAKTTAAARKRFQNIGNKDKS